MSNHSPLAMSCWTRYWTITVIIGLVVMNGLFVVGTPTARAADDVGYIGPSFPDGMGSPSTSKPQSKLWWNDGFWWASMWDSARSRFRIHKLDLATQTWISTGPDLDDRSKSTRSDTLWDDTNKKLYVASHIPRETNKTGPGATTSERGQLWRFRYNASTDTYSLDTGFPVKINDAKSETLVIDRASNGQLWATWVQQTTATSGVYTVYVNRTIATNGVYNDASWGTPFELPVSNTNKTVHADDISALIAFGGNKIGVLWSNQSQKKMFFAVHQDADADDVWQPEQTALPGPNHCKTGEACADDHINLASLQDDGHGRVYAAIKTSLTSLNAPQTMLLVRGTDGNWTSNVFGTVSDDHSRPIVMLDTTNRRIHMFATLDAPGSTTGGSIYEKSTSIDSPSFAQGIGTPFIEEAATPGRDGRLNDATSTKQNVNCATGLVVLASNTSTDRYWHSFTQIPGCGTPPPSGDTTAPTVSISEPANGATVSGTAVAVSASASDNVGVAGVQFKLNGSSLGAEDTTAPYSITWDTTKVANGSHTLTAVARDAAGNSTTSAGVTVTVSNTTTPPPTGTNLLGNGDFETAADGTTTTPAIWTGTTTWKLSTEQVHGGSKAGKYYVGDTNSRTLSQVVSNLSAGAAYNFSVWTNIPTASTLSFTVDVIWRNASNGNIRTDTIATYSTVTGGWKQDTKSFTTPTGTTNALVRIRSSAANTAIYVDDFTMQAP